MLHKSILGGLVIGVLLALSPISQAQTSQGSAGRQKKIVFLAGKMSHGYGAHEHFAGCALLAKKIEEGMPGYQCDVYKYDWPQDNSAFKDADCIVMYADGGAGHPAIPHVDEIEALARKGVGIVCLHYAVEFPKGEIGNRFLQIMGGYFEPHWSVNPHWVAQFDSLPDHPICRGVQPFKIEDEWYFHMRFLDAMKGVTPILSAVPPKETMSRPDGPHSGNPQVRLEVEQGLPQHVAWATERSEGGRSFGFTGGHDHWNWGHDSFRKIVLNAIVWAAHGDVPENGVEGQSVGLNQLKANQDYAVPENYDFGRASERISKPSSSK